MRIIVFLLFIPLIFLTACEPSAEKNKLKLSDEEMVDVMFDMHFADVMLSEFSPEQRDSISEIFWKRMNELYGMSEAEIREEVTKLENDSEKMKAIIGRVKERADSIQ